MREDDDDPDDPLEPTEHISMLLGQPPGLCDLCKVAPIQTVMYVSRFDQKADLRVCRACYTEYNGAVV